MKIEFISPSDKELIEAYEYYEDQLKGLGELFIDEFNTIIKTIVEHPSIWIKVGRRTRKALIKRFPYLILYIYENKTIHITCIAHQHRNPTYYIDRIV